MTQDDRDMLIEIHRDVRAINKIMYDNGQPGLLTRFSRIEVSHQECQERNESPKQWPAVVASICAIIAVIYSLMGDNNVRDTNRSNINTSHDGVIILHGEGQPEVYEGGARVPAPQ